VVIAPIPKYPHMLPFEAELWDRFLAQVSPPFVKLEYDVHVGDYPEPPPDLPEWLKNAYISVYRKRIDVVAHRDDVIFVIEVKHRAGMSALGQVLAYKYLYIRDFKPQKPVAMRIVCEREEPNIKEIAQSLDVFIWRV